MKAEIQFTRLVTDINGLNTLSRIEMLAALDTLIDHWADTSTMMSSIEEAEAKGIYRLDYLVPGMSVNDWFKKDEMPSRKILNIHSQFSIILPISQKANNDHCWERAA
jgi:hypothetical protein